MIDNRTISLHHPGGRLHLRRAVHGLYRPQPAARDPERARAKAGASGLEVIRQFTQDIHIWSHQRFSDPPALAGSEHAGFTAIRNWAKQFYPRRYRRQRRRRVRSAERLDSRDRFHPASSRVAPATSAPEMIKALPAARRPETRWCALLFAREDRQRDVGELVGIGRWA